MKKTLVETPRVCVDHQVRSESDLAWRDHNRNGVARGAQKRLE